MSATAHKLMDADEFLAWSLGREGVWELVDGVPLMKRASMMSFTTQQHNTVANNINFALRTRLRGRCRVWTESIGVQVSARKVRRPDVIVDCGPPDPKATTTPTPTVLFEVVSPSTRRIDFHLKPVEYQSIESLQHFIIIEPGVPACTVWSRGEDGRWDSRPVIGLDSAIELTALGITLPMAEVYEGVELDERV